MFGTREDSLIAIEIIVDTMLQNIEEEVSIQLRREYMLIVYNIKKKDNIKPKKLNECQEVFSNFLKKLICVSGMSNQKHLFASLSKSLSLYINNIYSIYNYNINDIDKQKNDTQLQISTKSDKQIEAEENQTCSKICDDTKINKQKTHKNDNKDPGLENSLILNDFFARNYRINIRRDTAPLFTELKNVKKENILKKRVICEYSQIATALKKETDTANSERLRGELVLADDAAVMGNDKRMNQELADLNFLIGQMNVENAMAS